MQYHPPEINIYFLILNIAIFTTMYRAFNIIIKKDIIGNILFTAENANINNENKSKNGIDFVYFLLKIPTKLLMEFIPFRVADISISIVLFSL
ncbi:hypothetical protein BSK49_14425 [Paenibacillus odorifer]|nr:hypothetical protein BSK49_14425 [Paenibacillus odorifer]